MHAESSSGGCTPGTPPPGHSPKTSTSRAPLSLRWRDHRVRWSVRFGPTSEMAASLSCADTSSPHQEKHIGHLVLCAGKLNSTPFAASPLPSGSCRLECVFHASPALRVD